MSHVPIAIIGAGITGLSCAYHLNNQAFLVFEKGSRIGGLLKTLERGRFYFDQGPHILYSTNSYCENIFREFLEDNLESKKREAWIFHNKYKKLTRFPYQAHLSGLPWFTILENLTEFYKTKYSNGKPLNYKDWIYYTLGRGIGDNFLVPYSRKFWRFELSGMSYDWVEKKVPRPSMSRIIKGAILGKSVEQIGFNSNFLYPSQGGIESLVKAFYRKINHKERIVPNSKVFRIYPDMKEIHFENGERISYDCLISTIPLNSLCELIVGIPSLVRSAVRSLQFVNLLIIMLGMRRPDLSPCQWLYFYEPEFRFHRISFPKSFSGQLAPSNYSSILAEITYSKNETINADEITNRLVHQLISIGVMGKDDEIIVSDSLKIEPAYIIPDLAYKKNTETIRSWLSTIAIETCGRFGEWKYYNIDECILSGQKTAIKASVLTKD